MINFIVECCYKDSKGHLVKDSHFFTTEDGVEAMDKAIDYFDKLYPLCPMLLSEPFRFEKIDTFIGIPLMWRVEYE